MIDKDNVIDGLDEIRHYNCEQMFYNDIFIRGIADDAMNLLKEQEAKKVNIWQTHCGMKYGLCPKCGKQIDTLVNANYCGSCGQELK